MKAKLLARERFDQILEKFNSIGPIAVYGDVGLDKYTQGTVDRISPEAPVPVLLVDKEWLQLGLAANISNNLTQLGIKSTLFSVIGDDAAANDLEDILSKKNLKSWGLLRDSTRKTTLKERITTLTQQICRVDYEMNDKISSSLGKKVLNSFSEIAGNHPALIIEDYSKGMITEEMVTGLISLSREQKKLIVVDPGKKTNPLFYKNVDLLKPNFMEAKLMVEALGYFGLTDVKEICQRLSEKLNLRYVVVTLGPKGMALYEKENHSYHLIPTVAPEVYDVSGAGDTAVSVLTASLLTGADLIEAAWMSNCAAGVVVGKYGTATVSRVELIEFFENLQKKLA
jgi:D-glycero-beta-D-manno-heptose-7-phosphate kinase